MIRLPDSSRQYFAQKFSNREKPHRASCQSQRTSIPRKPFKYLHQKKCEPGISQFGKIVAAHCWKRFVLGTKFRKPKGLAGCLEASGQPSYQIAPKPGKSRPRRFIWLLHIPLTSGKLSNQRTAHFALQLGTNAIILASISEQSSEIMRIGYKCDRISGENVLARRPGGPQNRFPAYRLKLGLLSLPQAIKSANPNKAKCLRAIG